MQYLQWAGRLSRPPREMDEWEDANRAKLCKVSRLGSLTIQSHHSHIAISKMLNRLPSGASLLHDPINLYSESFSLLAAYIAAKALVFLNVTFIACWAST